MKTQPIHPDLDDLEDYILLPGDRDTDQLQDHIGQCDHCQLEVMAIKKLRTRLLQNEAIKQDVAGSGHLSDEVIYDYVNGGLSSGVLELVNTHLNCCNRCMVSVLRFRASRIDYLERNPNAVKKSGLVFTVASKLKHFFKHILSWSDLKMPLWVAVPLALVVAVGTYMWQFIEKPTGMGVSDVEIAKSDENVNRVKFYTSGGHVPVSQQDKLIDWYNGFIESTAVGTATLKNVDNPVQAELMAKKAARHIAYANISETVDGLAINSHATYRDFATEIDALQVKTQGFIRGGQVVKESVEWIDGIPKVAVTVRVPLFGSKGVEGLLREAAAKVPGFINPAVSAQMVGNPGDENAKRQSERPLIIDARGIGYKPALEIAIFNGKSDRVYTGISGLLDNGKGVQFFQSVDQAKASPPFAKQPFVLKANEVRGAGELVVDWRETGVAQQGELDKLLAAMPDNVAIVF